MDELRGLRPGGVHVDIKLLTAAPGKYVFISSASAFGTPPSQACPSPRQTPLHNPLRQLLHDEIACESQALARVSVRRLSDDNHTPWPRLRPAPPGSSRPVAWNDIVRMGQGRCRGDVRRNGAQSTRRSRAGGGLRGSRSSGSSASRSRSTTRSTSPTITPRAEARFVEIELASSRRGGTSENVVHVPSEVIAAVQPDLGPGLVSDKARSMVFDNGR